MRGCFSWRIKPWAIHVSKIQKRLIFDKIRQNERFQPRGNFWLSKYGRKFPFGSGTCSTLDARGLLARQRRGASERVVLVGSSACSACRFATRLRGFAAQFCLPQREKKPLAPRVHVQAMCCHTALVALLLTEIEVVSGNDNRITQDNYIMINSTGLQP